MHDIVSRGQALYWGTSNWPAEAIRAAVEVAERHHLHKPVVEQPQYNLLHRDRVEKWLSPVCERARHRAHDVEPARLRDPDGQVPQRHP